MRKLLRFAPLLSFALSLPVAANTVTWQFTGTFTDATWDAGLPPQIAVGLPFTVQLSFDPDVAFAQKLLDSTDGNGFRYRFPNVSLSMTLTAGAFGPVTFQNDAPTPIIVRDNFPVTAGDAGSPQTDGITLGVIDKFFDSVNGSDLDAAFSVGFRSTDLGLYNIVNDKIPAAPPAAFDGFQARFFQACGYVSNPDNFNNGCDRGLVVGQLTSARVVQAVPEPAAVAMMLSGLLVLGGAARRRTKA